MTVEQHEDCGFEQVPVIAICAGCESPDEVLALDESGELWFCRECSKTDIRDAWLDLGESSG